MPNSKVKESSAPAKILSKKPPPVPPKSDFAKNMFPRKVPVQSREDATLQQNDKPETSSEAENILSPDDPKKKMQEAQTPGPGPIDEFSDMQQSDETGDIITTEPGKEFSVDKSNNKPQDGPNQRSSKSKVLRSSVELVIILEKEEPLSKSVKEELIPSVVVEEPEQIKVPPPEPGVKKGLIPKARLTIDSEPLVAVRRNSNTANHVKNKKAMSIQIIEEIGTQPGFDADTLENDHRGSSNVLESMKEVKNNTETNSQPAKNSHKPKRVDVCPHETKGRTRFSRLPAANFRRKSSQFIPISNVPRGHASLYGTLPKNPSLNHINPSQPNLESFHRISGSTVSLYDDGLRTPYFQQCSYYPQDDSSLRTSSTSNDRKTKYEPRYSTLGHANQRSNKYPQIYEDVPHEPSVPYYPHYS